MNTKKHCVGCRDNYYNHPPGGTGCWSLPDAKMVDALDIPVSMRPPYNDLPLVSRPNCYRAQGYVRVLRKSLTKEGYWR